MPDPSKGPVNDDDLLANAIPITSDDEEVEDLAPIELEESDSTTNPKEITSFGTKAIRLDDWKRAPNKDGKGATHCKTFISKLRLDGIQHLDDQINEWLDEHPDYEVKFATSSVGLLVGKNPEQALFMTVWV